MPLGHSMPAPLLPIEGLCGQGQSRRRIPALGPARLDAERTPNCLSYARVMRLFGAPWSVCRYLSCEGISTTQYHPLPLASCSCSLSLWAWIFLPSSSLLPTMLPYMATEVPPAKCQNKNT
ncbi:hypothetical protein EJ06DRAFT_221234 [Trichodelitschia bisporula]|uniref:Uncharacterized protein n=1 Tax=Trichodelitschia bisporula TaxID=703511 RepID=A0A6G1HKF5_9PEZI|nr:hypothetical protein EJ06DRAFT_221234 [Trichodelitschia bisporula]